MTLYDKLIQLKDEKYQIFQSKLVPNIASEIIIGVRTPQLRSLAKEVFKSDYKDAFLSSVPHTYYVENLIHFMDFQDLVI